jgi:UDPglucose 6-dehydrogenase
MQSKLGKPESHSDVINKEPKTLLIGYGWVGQFVHKYFTQADIWTPNSGLLLRFSHADRLPEENRYQRFEPYDKDGSKSLIKGYNGAEADTRWDVAFISTPSPMNKDGSCDTSMVEQAIERWHEHVDLFIIRSTVTPGTTDRLAEKYNTKVVMQPEYVGETLGHPLVEPQRDPFIILGGKPEAVRKAAECWSKVLHANCRIRQMDSLTAEYCKYMENCFLATKVMFVNDWARLCRATGVDYLTLREAWLDDPRIGRSHTLAYEDNPGFSGKCLPKDLNAIAVYAREAGQPLELVEFLLEMNARMRKDVKNTIPLLPEDKAW